MAQTAGGTYYAASSELVSSWPATSLNLANQLESRFAAKAPLATYAGTSANFTVAASDVGKIYGATGNFTVTLPTTGATGFGSGDSVNFWTYQSAITVSVPSGVTLVDTPGGDITNTTIVIPSYTTFTLRRYSSALWMYENCGSWRWIAYTPTLAQGATGNITKTVTSARYTRVGNTVTVAFDLAPTAAGTAGSVITVSLPVTAKTSGLIVGSGTYLDANVQNYQGAMFLASTSTASLIINANSTALGSSPNMAVANGDVFKGTFTYEAA